MKPKRLYWDIESSPILGWSYELYDATVFKVEQDWIMLSWSIDLDGKKVTKALCDYPGYKKNSKDDKALVTELWEHLNKADILIAHNGDGFDIKKTNERFVCHGLLPPAPYKTIDTLKIARRKFKFTSNRLDYICEKLGIGRKKETEKELWYKCLMLQDLKAWKKLKEYNQQDVTLLKPLHKILMPWIDNHPTFIDGLRDCPNCHSLKLQRRGEGFNKLGKYQRLQCMDCGAWSQVKI